MSLSDEVYFKLQEMSRSHPTNFMAVFLMVLRAGNTSFEAYAKSLPDQPALLSFMYSPDQLQRLTGSMLKSFSEKRYETSKLFYDQMISPLIDSVLGSDSNLGSFHRFQEALAFIWSRTHSVYNNEYNSTRPALVPLGDLLNFDIEPNVKSYTDQMNMFVYRTTRDVAAGEQLFVEYSSGVANYQLMMDYGFCINSSDHDVVFLDVSPTIQSELSQSKYQVDPVLVRTKHQLLQVTKLFGYTGIIRLSQSQIRRPDATITTIVDKQIIQMMRILLADQNEIYKLTQQVDAGDTGVAIGPISDENEKRVFHKLIDLSKQAIQAYSVTSDSQLELSYEDRCIVSLLEQEKGILSQFIVLLESW